MNVEYALSPIIGLSISIDFLMAPVLFNKKYFLDSIKMKNFSPARI